MQVIYTFIHNYGVKHARMLVVHVGDSPIQFILWAKVNTGGTQSLYNCLVIMTNEHCACMSTHKL